MRSLWRIVDAEYNRVTEGLRVLEDLARFHWEDPEASSQLKLLRTEIAGLVQPFRQQMLQSRDAEHDLGLAISQSLQLDRKDGPAALAAANFKRVQEALRSLEEHLKVLDGYEAAKSCERLRFTAYQLEKQAALAHKPQPRLPKTDIYGLTDRPHALGRSNPETVREMLAAGIRIIQYREKDLKMAEKYRECLEIRKMTADYGATFIVNDDVHLALAVQADGVHLGQDDLPVEQARALTSASMIIGLSTHSPEQAQAAVRAGVDYIGVGPIYATQTKRDVCAPVGLTYLDYVVDHLSIPFVAIGGIKQHNIGDVVRHGATCIALVTAIVGATDIKAQVQALREEIKRASEGLQ
jgi:thiamine-phosphate pyrophosphorylase